MFKHLKYSASIVDLSEEGSQIRTKAKLKVGDKVSLEVPENNLVDYFGEVRWVKRSINNNYAGILFKKKNEEE